MRTLAPGCHCASQTAKLLGKCFHCVSYDFAMRVEFGWCFPRITDGNWSQWIWVCRLLLLCAANHADTCSILSLSAYPTLRNLWISSAISPLMIHRLNWNKALVRASLCTPYWRLLHVSMTLHKPSSWCFKPSLSFLLIDTSTLDRAGNCATHHFACT